MLKASSRRRIDRSEATMPTVLRVSGFRFFFYSLEGSEPPHIHVEHGDNVAKFWLEPVSLAESRGFRSPSTQSAPSHGDRTSRDVSRGMGCPFRPLNWTQPP